MTTSSPETPGAERSRYRYLVLFILLIVYCLSYVDRQIIGILALPIKTDLQLSDTQLGLMGGFAFAIFYTGAGIPIARLADRFNRVWIISASLTIWSGFTAVCGLATGFWSLFLARLGVGVGEAGGVAPSFSIVADYFPPRQRARAFAVLTLALPVGSAMGLFIGGVLAAQYGWRTAFIAMGVIGVLVAPLLLFTVREPVRGRLDPAPLAAAKTRPSFIDVLSHVRRKPSFWWLSIGSAMASMLSYGVGFWLPAFIHRSHGLELVQTSQFLSALTLFGGVIGILAGGWLGDLLGARHKAAYALVPAAAFLIGFPFLLVGLSLSSLPIVFAVLMVPQAASVLWTGPSVAAIQQLAPATMRATASSIYLFITNLIGLGVGTFVFGAVSDILTARFGDNALQYSIMACAVVLYPLAILFYWLASRSLTRDWEGAAVAPPVP
ncbi:MAG: MFS transporter [Alphaproteobacteria bacterium]|nr:MAG: MFS transporter [Alphaproteobacteria bacterium]